MLGTEPDFSKNPANPRITSVWRGWIDGGIVQVNAGSEGKANDPLQGILIVDDWSARTSDTYYTPQRLGPVSLVAVDGKRVTVVLVDFSTPGVLRTPAATQTPGTYFVFDLATRQWVSAGSTMPAATPNYKDDFETYVAETRSVRRTTVALTAAPTRTPGPPPTYPTYTPVLGMLPGEPDFSKNPKNPIINSGWRGWLDGRIVELRAGSQGKARDPGQGVLIVNVWSDSYDVYDTPRRMGPVRIVSMDGTRVTLVPVDFRTPGVLQTPWATQTPGTYFVFDLATRQWLSP
jgi:hypothetical protein